MSGCNNCIVYVFSWLSTYLVTHSGTVHIDGLNSPQTIDSVEMASAARSIVRCVLPTKAGPIHRLVGSLDFKGQGTKHELAGLDPVVLCDYTGTMSGAGKPPFGLHPHYGMIAVTTVLEGCFMDRDNINPPDGHLNEAGGIYTVSAGRGGCHEEKTEGNHEAIQTIFKIPEDKKDLLPELVKVRSGDLPMLEVGGGSVKVLIGRMGQLESPAKLKALPRVVMLIVKLVSGGRIDVPLDADLEHGFVFVISGKCRLGGGEGWCEAGKGVWLFGGGEGLEVEAGEEEVEMLVVAGKPLNEPWVKLLGNNGFIITSTEEEAEKVMEVVNNTGDQFTYLKI